MPRNQSECHECNGKGYTKFHLGIHEIICYDLKPIIGGLGAAGWYSTICPYCRPEEYWEVNGTL